jgi:hypothetical protein
MDVWIIVLAYYLGDLKSDEKQPFDAYTRALNYLPQMITEKSYYTNGIQWQFESDITRLITDFSQTLGSTSIPHRQQYYSTRSSRWWTSSQTDG